MNDRALRADHICRRLVARINAETPAGAGLVDDVWVAVERPSKRFMDTLAAYERGEAEEPAVVQAGQKLRQAWQRGVEAFA